MNKEELALASREPSGESRRDASAQLKENPSSELRTRIKTVIDMEQRSASMAPITPLFISRMLNVPQEEVEAAMKETEGEPSAR